MVAAPHLWNNLPLEVKRAPNIDNFKKLLKTFLFKKLLRMPMMKYLNGVKTHF